MSASTPLVGRCALVTGASRGIGAAIARSLAGAGAAVGVNYVLSGDEARSVADEIVGSGGRAVAIKADVTTPGGVAALVAGSQDLGPVDILVNNAGRHNERKPFRDLAWDDFERQIDVTIRSAFACTRAFLPGMVERGWGRIIMVGSIAVHRPTAGSYAYLTAKAGLSALARTLALEVAADGVTVNVIEPALVLTDRADAFSDEFKRRYAEEAPMGHIATPEEIAEATVLLASDAARSVTGAAINVSGGIIVDW